MLFVIDGRKVGNMGSASQEGGGFDAGGAGTPVVYRSFV